MEYLETLSIWQTNKKICILFIVLFLLSACVPDLAATNPKPPLSPTATSTQGSTPTESINTSTATSTAVDRAQSITPSPSPSPTVAAHPTIGPTIHPFPGSLYETVFSIPVSSESAIQYQELPGAILGPNAIAILPDDTFLIAEHTTNHNRLLNYDESGNLLRTIDLDSLGISYAADLRVRDGALYLLELTNNGRYKIHQLSLDGSIINSDEIPEKFPSSSGKHLAAGEVSIAIDCERNVLMEVEGGLKVYRFSEVQTHPSLAELDEGYPCNGRVYRVLESDGFYSSITAGEAIYETRLTTGFGGLFFLDVFANGSFFVVRSDVVNERVIQVDQTIHFVGADGVVQAVARIPLSEFYYPVMRNIAISSSGEAFVLLPRQNSLDVIRLNFYRELEPLIPGAAPPTITANP